MREDRVFQLRFKYVIVVRIIPTPLTSIGAPLSSSSLLQAPLHLPYGCNGRVSPVLNITAQSLTHDCNSVSNSNKFNVVLVGAGNIMFGEHPHLLTD